MKAQRAASGDIFSSVASILVRRGISAVAGHAERDHRRGGGGAVAGPFYEALADNWPVDAAVAEARKAVASP